MVRRALMAICAQRATNAFAEHACQALVAQFAASAGCVIRRMAPVTLSKRGRLATMETRVPLTISARMANALVPRALSRLSVGIT